LTFLHEMGSSMQTPSLFHNLAYVALRQGDCQKATALFNESLEMFREQGNKKGVAECLVGLAGVMGTCGQARWSATLLGAAEATREALGVTLWPANQIEHDRNVAAVRARLDEATFTAAWAEGRAMTMEQAIAYALAETDK
jgi:hypothetical protein